MTMNDEDFAGILSGLNDVKDYLAGQREGFAVREGVDVKAIRKAANKTQKEFAETYHLPVTTVRDWEQRRRRPDAPALALLALIQADPEAVERMMAKAMA